MPDTPENKEKVRAALEAAGSSARSAWDLIDAEALDPREVSALIEVLPTLTPGNETEGIVRTLRRSAAREKRLAEVSVPGRAVVESSLDSGARIRRLRRPKDRPGVMEYSSNFDTAGLEELLARVVERTGGSLGQVEAAGILAIVDDMELDEELTLEVPVSGSGKPPHLELTIFLDDVESPEVTFRATPELAGIIAAEHDRLG